MSTPDVRQLNCYKVKIDRSWKRNMWARHPFQAIIDRHYDYMFKVTPDSELAKIKNLSLDLKMNGNGAHGTLVVNGGGPVNVAATLDH